jgi:hypothetical protein
MPVGFHRRLFAAERLHKLGQAALVAVFHFAYHIP